MRTKSVIGVVLCFGVAFAMIGGSGIGAAIFGENPDDHQTTRALDEIAEDAAVDGEEDEPGGLSAEVAGDSEPTLVGVAISGGQFAASLVGAVALLPVTLMQLGMPGYAAVPLGGMAQIVALIGLVQFIRGVAFE